MAPRKRKRKAPHAPVTHDYKSMQGDELIQFLLDADESLLRNDAEYRKTVKGSSKIPYICTVCRSPLLKNKIEWVCGSCGLIFEPAGRVLQDSYDARLNYVQKYEYQRVTHFRDCLTQKQGAENSDVPRYVLDKLSHEFRRHRYDERTVTPGMVKALLNKIKQAKYYEHTPLIVAYFTGRNAFEIEPQVEQQLLHLFSLIQEPFLRCKPPERTNFLSYPYVISKMFLLLGMEDHAKHFPLLKSRDKLLNADTLWEDMCGMLGFEFFPSF